MRIFITGINGFLGHSLAARLRAAGVSVGGSARQSTVPGVVRLELGKRAPPDAFAGYDTVIHAAWDLADASAEANQAGTRLLVDQAGKEGVVRQIFISSHSARRDAVTVYGATKFATEALFSGSEWGVVLRPGLVVGAGGLFWRLNQWVLTRRIVPMIAGGRFVVPFIAMDDLATALLRLLETPLAQKRTWALYHPEVPDQRQLVAAMCQAQGVKRLLIPVPASLTFFLLRGTEALGLELPLNSANVRAALDNRAPANLSDLARLIPNPVPLEAAIRLAVQARATHQIPS